MSVYLDVENVVAVADCNRTFDIDELVMNNKALKDLKIESAKYVFKIPSRKEKEVIVRVYDTGNILCQGSNSIDVAIKCTRRVLEILGVDVVIHVSRVVFSGTMDIGKTLTIQGVNLLQTKFAAMTENEIIGGAVTISGKDAYVQIFPNSNPVKIVANGPDEDKVRRVVDEIYNTLRV